MRRTESGMPRLFVVLSLALAGLMLLQVLLLKYAWDLKEQAFVGGAQSALAATVLALESGEIEGSALEYYFGRVDSSVHDIEVVTTTSTTRAPGPPAGERRQPARRGFRREQVRAVPGDTADSLVVVLRPEFQLHERRVSGHGDRPVELRHVVGQWINRAPQAITERLDPAQVAELLREELGKVGIDAAARFGVLQSGRQDAFGFAATIGDPRHGHVHRAARPDEVVMASDGVTNAELFASPYRQRLFPLDPFAVAHDLVLVFPARGLYVFWQIWPLWLASFLFMTVISLSFLRAWRTNLEQRRFAGQLVDFINNMTHEFKTPISTVALAGEALGREDVRRQPEVQDRYLGMIRDENERMHRQVEKILQMARFERGDLDLRQERVCLHEVLAAAAESFSLQVEGRGGHLQCRLAAPRSTVLGDRVHLAGIFTNLLDNAVKYSGSAPRVILATGVQGHSIRVEVQDHGVGIAREEQRRVFEKYYRCPTGNRHDVKGHGLGLAFVRTLVEAHGGEVSLASTPGVGTTVTVLLPLAGAAGQEGP